jgi:hypothetical protein
VEKEVCAYKNNIAVQNVATVSPFYGTRTSCSRHCFGDFVKGKKEIGERITWECEVAEV